ncbi:MAG TPA: NADAR domain-containing protein [Saprospiraceae bacterium]|nr:NADAR domain-containing protein [Saprospiraceae bacterium]
MKKYSTVEHLLEEAPQCEKDDFLRLRRKVEVSYDENPLGDQHALDAFLRVVSLQEESYTFDDQHPYFSVFSSIPFEGQTNLFFSGQYLLDTFPNKYKFNSISQYFQFHSAILFLDRSLGQNILDEKVDDFLSIGQAINNFNKQVWSRYRIFIMHEGLKSLYESNEHFRVQLNNTSNQSMVYHSSISYWGMGKTSSDQNYWGKLLTRMKLASMSHPQASSLR